ncbi:MAG: urea transporter [Bacteroidetes bacterium]|nr:urea transporter [Bacteroidota bacterium]MBS1650293.1 urea transporter [Bacteroidota bacterium]
MNKYFSEIYFVDAIVKGIGQIMLQENKLTGLFFIIGLFVGNWQCAVAAIIGSAIGTITAALFQFNKNNINVGLYGFNSALVGIALISLFANILFVWVLIIIGAIVVALVHHIFIEKRIPGYTFPFIVVTWLLFFLIRQYTHIPPSDFVETKFVQNQFNIFFSVTNGFGQVMFQSNKLSGILFFIGVLLNSPAAALYGFIASLAGFLFSLMHVQSITQSELGLFGFNALLTAIVFSTTKKTTLLWVIAGSVITILIHVSLIHYSIFNWIGGVFTFPFVVGTWITLLIKKNCEKYFSATKNNLL